MSESKAVVQVVVKAVHEGDQLDDGTRKLEEKKEKWSKAAALMARVKFEDMSYADAWAVLFPEDAELPRRMRTQRAYRLLRWYGKHYPSNFQLALDINNLGRHRVLQELKALLMATKWERSLERWVPDWKIRAQSFGFLTLVNGITSQGDYIESAIQDARTKGARELDVGPEFETAEEWYEMAMKVQREAEKTYAKPVDLQQPQRQLPPRDSRPPTRPHSR